MYKDKLLDDIKNFLNNTYCAYDKQEIINDECKKGIIELEGKYLDELAVTELDENNNEKFIMDLQSYTEEVFDNIIRLVCNVINSYKDY